jgi:hypothetical protein
MWFSIDWQVIDLEFGKTLAFHCKTNLVIFAALIVIGLRVRKVLRDRAKNKPTQTVPAPSIKEDDGYTW